MAEEPGKEERHAILREAHALRVRITRLFSPTVAVSRAVGPGCRMNPALEFGHSHLARIPGLNRVDAWSG